ncbi:hypothetical protein RMDY18_07010 [Rothia mucilaginosa DY-18]|uniref:Uncharacterized protein n=1 Tax=Rothia mucilaginosa (strain DY-18) TaxID=680646 RepID=D2NSA7_ROTMD|nr:hypothetical protein RMDY18_07010 [Rothia mucilaginosa DY-18]
MLGGQTLVARRNSHAVVRVVTNLADHVTVTVLGTNLKALLSGLIERNEYEKHANRNQDRHRTGDNTGQRECLTCTSFLDLLQGQHTQNDCGNTQQSAKHEETGQHSRNTENHRRQRHAGSLLRHGSRIRVTCGLTVTVSILLRLLLVRVLLVVVVSGLRLVGSLLAVTVLILLSGLRLVGSVLTIAVLLLSLTVGVLSRSTLGGGTLSNVLAVSILRRRLRTELTVLVLLGRVLRSSVLLLSLTVGVLSGCALTVILAVGILCRRSLAVILTVRALGGRIRLLSSVGVLCVPLVISVVILRHPSFFPSQLQRTIYTRPTHHCALSSVPLYK